jgi:hypothetical protein
MQSQPVKIGLWGGAGGQPREPIRTPSRLYSVVVGSGVAIDSIQFTYKDSSGAIQDEQLWGGAGGSKERVREPVER